MVIKTMSFTIPNAKQVIELNTDTTMILPQEVMMADLKRSIAKTIGKIHPLSLGQFIKGMEDIGAIQVHGQIVSMLIFSDEL